MGFTLPVEEDGQGGRNDLASVHFPKTDGL